MGLKHFMKNQLPNTLGDFQLSAGEISQDGVDMTLYRMIGKISETLLSI